MNGLYYLENSFMIVGPHGSTGYYLVTNFIFGPGGFRTGYWVNETTSTIVNPDGSDSGFWIESGVIWGTGQAPWLS